MGGRAIAAALLLAGLAAAGVPARADVVIRVDKTSQRMTVLVDGQERHVWAVSTGMTGYQTPAGSYAPLRLARVHFSREWDDAPMPHSIFFTSEGHAIHGSLATGRLGSPASHGCVRLAPSHAALLFALVSSAGLSNTRVEITGDDLIAAGVGGAPEGARTYGHLTNFDPLTVGIMSPATGRRPR